MLSSQGGQGAGGLLVAFLQILGFCLAVIGLPLLLIWYEGEQTLKALRHDNLRNHARELDHRLDSYLNFSNLDWYLKNQIRQAREQYYQNPSGIEGLKEMKTNLQKKFPGLMEFLFVDTEDRAIHEWSDIHPPADLLASFVQDYRRYIKDERGPLQRNAGKYRVFLGPLFGLLLDGALAGRFEFASVGEKRATVFMGGFDHLGVYFVFCSNPPDFESRVHLQIVEGINQENFPGSCVLIDMEKPLHKQKLFGHSVRNLERILIALGNQPRKSILAFGKIWAQEFVTPSIRLLVCDPDEQRPEWQLQRERLWQVLLGVFLGVSLIISLWMGRQKHRAFTIPQKFTFLFGYIVGIPLLLLGISSLGLLREHRQILIRQLQSRQETFLRQIDRSFKHYLGSQDKTIKKALNITGLASDQLLKKAQNRLQALCRTYELGVCELFDSKGKSYFHIRTTMEESAGNLVKIFAEQAQKMLYRLNRGEGNPVAETKSQLLEASVEMMGLKVGMVSALFEESLGAVRELPVKQGFNFTSIPIYDVTGNAAYLAMLGWTNQASAFRYIRTKTPRHNSFSDKSWVWLSNADYHAPSLPFPFRKTVYSIFERVRDQKLSFKYFVNRRGETYYMTIFPSQNIKTFLIVAVNDDHRIQQELKVIAGKKFLVSALLLLLGLLVGKFFSQHFLGPVRHLDQGLVALGERRFDFRLPSSARDELGDAIQAFNLMMEGLQDLEVASTLQENFFPRQPAVLGNWKITGSCLPASRVGGDYFDYFAIDDHQLLIIIGDVSGHGIAAALVVAMAKALIAHPKTGCDPAKILTMMQRVFLATLRKEKMMTCQVALLDIREGTLTLANAGHLHPYLIRDGHANFLTAGGVGLGVGNISRPSIYKAQRITLAEKDCLVFWTDGFLEATAHDGKQLGFVRVTSVLPGLVRETPEATEKELRRWHAEVVRPGPLDDDITLVILQCLPNTKVVETPG